MNLPEVNGYILYLMPDDSSAQIFRNEINRLASKYDAIPFEPHITISRVPETEPRELIEAVKTIGKKLNSYRVEFSDAIYGEHPYQKITLPVIYSPEFYNTCDVIDSVLEGEFSKRIFPHLSLLYGNFTEKIVWDDILVLKKCSYSSAEIKYLALFKLDGLPNDWQMVFRTELS